MLRFFLQTALLVTVFVIFDVQSNENEQDDIEKRTHQTLADMIKEMNVSLNIMKTE